MVTVVQNIFSNLMDNYPSLKLVSDEINAAFELITECYRCGGKIEMEFFGADNL